MDDIEEHGKEFFPPGVGAGLEGIVAKDSKVHTSVEDKPAIG